MRDVKKEENILQTSFLTNFFLLLLLLHRLPLPNPPSPPYTHNVLTQIIRSEIWSLWLWLCEVCFSCWTSFSLFSLFCKSAMHFCGIVIMHRATCNGSLPSCWRCHRRSCTELIFPREKCSKMSFWLVNARSPDPQAAGYDSLNAMLAPAPGK